MININVYFYCLEPRWDRDQGFGPTHHIMIFSKFKNNEIKYHDIFAVCRQTYFRSPKFESIQH